MNKRMATLIVGVTVAALLQAGCGGGGESEDTTGPTNPTVSSEETANPQN